MITGENSNLSLALSLGSMINQVGNYQDTINDPEAHSHDEYPIQLLNYKHYTSRKVIYRILKI